MYGVHKEKYTLLLTFAKSARQLSQGMAHKLLKPRISLRIVHDLIHFNSL